jgi:hypothetical protein
VDVEIGDGIIFGRWPGRRGDGRVQRFITLMP